MNAIVVSKWVQSSDELSPSIIPEPVPTDDNVIVQIRAIGLNFFDDLLVRGLYQMKPKFPFIPGAEFAGVVIYAGKNTNFKINDCVYGTDKEGLNSYAEKIAVTPTQYSLFHIPKALSFREAVCIPMIYPTSWLGLIHRGGLKRGEICLVHAAAGGVGIAAVQIAKHVGAIVIATASTKEKLDICKFHGADYVIDYKDKSWIKRVNDITMNLGRQRPGVDVVYDPVGLVNDSLKCIAWNGRIIVVGFAAGSIEKIPTNLLLLKSATVMGVFYGATIKNEPSALPSLFHNLEQLFDQVKPVAYPIRYTGLKSIPIALKDLVERRTYGKVVVELPASSKFNSKL